MRFVIQRVKKASVSVGEETVGEIKKGYLVLIGVSEEDTETAADKMIRKMIGLRLFEDEADDARTRNQRIGFVFQDHRLLPQYTVLENILLPTLAYQATSKREQVERARGLMRSTGIEALADRYPAGLSGGESSRVALCRALIMNPALVLADEPTGQLDADNARAIACLLAGMNQEMGTTVIMVTHSDEMASYAKQVKILNKGCLE